MVRVDWKGNMAFEATPPSGVKFVMDAYPESGGGNLGPTPLEAMLSSVAACSAMDVISILRKKKQNVTEYRVEVEGERGPEGQYPRPFLSLTVRHIVKGENLDPAAVARAVELSDSKYCTVISTLRAAPKIESVWEIEQ
ncbi:MAG: OsmC family protein [Fimbriimonadales bacterium]|nr:OsmC family protein [Fimbriimonadales bacterium]